MSLLPITVKEPAAANGFMVFTIFDRDTRLFLVVILLIHRQKSILLSKRPAHSILRAKKNKSIAVDTTCVSLKFFSLSLKYLSVSLECKEWNVIKHALHYVTDE